MVDLSAFAIFDVTGPGALDYLQRLVVGQMDVPVGRVVYTPLLNEAGGIIADLTIMRLAHDRFRVVTGGGMGMRDKKWFTRPPARPTARRSSTTRPRPGARSGSGGRGPATSSRRRPRTTSRTTGFPFGTARTIEIGGVPVAGLADLVRRRARLGDLRPDGAGRSGCGTRSGRPASRTASSPVGIGVYGTTGRLEKGYRAHGNELELEFDLVEAGMARPKVKEADFIGKDGVPRAAVASRRSRSCAR